VCKAAEANKPIVSANQLGTREVRDVRADISHAGESMNCKPKLLYLIGQYPAINHGYLLAEVRHLRDLGFQIDTVSVSLPDRPKQALTQAEREEAARTYYIKSLSPMDILRANLAEFILHPLRYLSGLALALRLPGLALGKIPYYFAYLAEAIILGRRMRDLGVAHVHANFSATVALIAARIFPITWSFGVHGFGELHDPSGTHLRERIKSAKFIRSISKFGRGQLMLSCQRSEWSKLLYCPLGIDPAEFAPRGNGPQQSSSIRLLSVGRLSQEKGQAILLESVAACAGCGLNLRLHLVGDGPDRHWLEQYAEKLGISSQVVFEGWMGQPELMAPYSNTDIFVLSSLAEGIPVVLLEAMALEKPCVAPYIAGIPELIGNGINGLLFSVGDSEELSEQICTLAGSVELRERMGKRARETVVRDYDMARNTARFGAILEQQLTPNTPHLD
jgi:colanic acid/amylovoran biosynthesis glycosyltransferase